MTAWTRRSGWHVTVSRGDRIIWHDTAASYSDARALGDYALTTRPELIVYIRNPAGRAHRYLRAIDILRAPSVGALSRSLPKSTQP
jgi:hypothetical protein